MLESRKNIIRSAMLKGKVAYDGAQLAKAMTAISDVPDQYVKLFPKGSEQGAVKDSKALPKIWEDFDGFKSECPISLPTRRPASVTGARSTSSMP